MPRPKTQLATSDEFDEFCECLTSGLTQNQAALSIFGDARIGLLRIHNFVDGDLETRKPKLDEARQRMMHRLVEAIPDITEEPVEDSVDVARNKLRVEARKWLASKVLPRLYGDKLQVETKGSVTLIVSTGVPESEDDDVLL